MAESKDSLVVDPVISALPSQSSLSLVSVKLPPFWAVQPKVWFAQAEAQFVLRGIVTKETKYQYLVASLDQDAAKRVVDLISDLPSKGKYEMLKTRLLATFSLSPYRMAQLLLETLPLGDRRPSHPPTSKVGKEGFSL
ncbi:uncharacterized protein LOC131882468 [Tigriopus californicus]|uniref:uncharacterized protein LOC131882468 n=1 Tax=Tigriopus californicus TaxID=6832 RepID=UPI0027DA0A40|nr:uncharacterized protein LOC131882468 [Tigriopus californicus]